MAIADFMAEQEVNQNNVANALEKIVEDCQNLTSKVCSAVEKKALSYRTGNDEDSDDEISKLKSMAAQRIALEKHKKEVKRTAIDESRLADFCKLID